MTTLPCPTCDRPAEVAEVAESAMQSGDVVVRVAGLAVATCSAGHRHRLPQGAVDAALAAVAEQLQVTRTRGLLSRRDMCGDCGADLRLPAWHSERPVPFDVDGRVLTVHVRAPMVRCPECAREQLTAAPARVLPDILAAAVEAATAAPDD
jgi:hypothetical protein